MKITEKVKTVIMGLAAVATLGSATLIAPAASAVESGSTDKTSYDTVTKYTNSADAGEGAGQKFELMPVLHTALNVVLGVIGFIAVVMIIVGGVQYTTSAGDAAKVTKAKNTILYGVVGLVIALLAFAIVNFILSNIFNAGS